MKTRQILRLKHVQVLSSLSKNFSTQKEKPREILIRNLAKNYCNVKLAKVPLAKSARFQLSNHEEIEKAWNSCNDLSDDNPNNYPSITTILSQTMPPESVIALKKWEQEKIKQLGLAGFYKYRNNLFSRGKQLHSNIESYLQSGHDCSCTKITTKEQENLWKSVDHVLEKIGSLHASEMAVHHPILKYRGIADTIASLDNVPTLIEWKTSEKMKPTLAHTYDNPLQLIAYYSCLQYAQFDVPKIKEAALVIAYEDGSKADVFLLESSLSKTLWKKFLKRLELFWSKNADDKL